MFRPNSCVQCVLSTRRKFFFSQYEKNKTMKVNVIYSLFKCKFKSLI